MGFYYIGVKKISCMSKKDILRNNASKFVIVLSGDFEGLAVQMMSKCPAGYDWWGVPYIYRWRGWGGAAGRLTDIQWGLVEE